MSLKLILGCMYSGKTTEILRIVNSLKHIDEIPLIIKPVIDNRYSTDKISTHNKQEYDCLSVNNLYEAKNITNNYIIIAKLHWGIRENHKVFPRARPISELLWIFLGPV